MMSEIIKCRLPSRYRIAPILVEIYECFVLFQLFENNTNIRNKCVDKKVQPYR